MEGANATGQAQRMLPNQKQFSLGANLSKEVKHHSGPVVNASMQASALTDSRAGNESCALRIDQGRRFRWGLLRRVRLLIRRIHRCRFISA